MSSKKKRRLKRNTYQKAKRHVSTAPLPWNGDHGTGTAAANENTEIIEIEGPNRMAHRRRINVIDTLTTLTMRQVQAAKEIQEAYLKVETLSSGGPLKEKVQASPKPDATIAVQVDAQSRLMRATRRILRSDRALVDHICWHNKPMRTAPGPRQLERFKQAMDRVADYLGY